MGTSRWRKKHFELMPTYCWVVSCVVLGLVAVWSCGCSGSPCRGCVVTPCGTLTFFLIHPYWVGVFGVLQVAFGGALYACDAIPMFRIYSSFVQSVCR